MASNGEGEAEAAQGALEVKVGARDLKRLRGLRVKNHFCSMITVSRRGDREGFRQLVPLGDAPHAIDRAQDWFRVELDRMLLFEDGHPAVFVVQGAQSSPMWLHVDAFIEEARADFGEDVDDNDASRTQADGLGWANVAQSTSAKQTLHPSAGPPSRLQEAVTQAVIQLSTLQALNQRKLSLLE